MAIKTNLKDLTPRREKFAKKIALLSGGYSCPEAFPNGEITVYPWDYQIDTWLQEARREAGMENEAILFRLLEKVCNLNGCPLERFVSGDVLTVLMVSRSIQTDCEIFYVASCPYCNHEEEDKIIVPDELVPMGKKPPGYPGHESITLPVVGDTLTIRPLLIGDEINILGRTPESKKLCPDSVARIVTMVETVGGERPDNMQELVAWYTALPPKDAKFLEDQENDITPHLELDLQQQCVNCKQVYRWPLNIGTEFFRSGRVGTFTKQVAKSL